jgi:hypothetical protein
LQSDDKRWCGAQLDLQLINLAHQQRHHHREDNPARDEKIIAPILVSAFFVHY